MAATSRRPRLNIYLDDPDLRVGAKMAAAGQGITVSGYCLEAVRRRLAEEGWLPAPAAGAGPQAAAQALDRLRRQVGPIGVPVRELIAEGRRQ